jgi:hypothetical protein
LDETAQLFEQGAGGSTVALERFDPVEPGQYCASLVHVTKLTRENAHFCVECVPRLMRRSRRRAGGRLRPYHARVKEETERFGGTVEKFVGDAVMAVFGAPIAHEDDSERAVNAALRILDAIQDLNDEQPGLNLRSETKGASLRAWEPAKQRQPRTAKKRSRPGASSSRRSRAGGRSSSSPKTSTGLTTRSSLARAV